MLEMDEKAGIAIDSRRPELSEEIVSRQYRLEPEIWERFGDRGREYSLRDQDFHLQYLSEAMRLAEPELFADYVGWANCLFENLGFPAQGLVTALECTREVIRESYPDEISSRADECLDAGLARVGAALPEIPSFIDQETSLKVLARRYLGALLGSDRRLASRLILEAVDDGTPVKDIYTDVFQACQWEIGRLWQTNRISVAQEHFCTASTQLIMSQLYPHVFATDRVGRRMVATCVGGELHEIGVRMVADFFEMEGWDTYYLGANTPADSVIKAISDQQADLLGISVTMCFHTHLLAELVSRVRSSFDRRLKILVGGYPFNVSPDLWRKVGADGFAPDAKTAIATADRLLENERANEPE